MGDMKKSSTESETMTFSLLDRNFLADRQASLIANRPGQCQIDIFKRSYKQSTK